VLDFSRSAASNRIVVAASSLRLSLAHVVLMSSSSSWEKTPTTRSGRTLWSVPGTDESWVVVGRSTRSSEMTWGARSTSSARASARPSRQ